MDQCLEEMRKLSTETLLNIINKERFEHKPEEVRAALYVLNERNVQYEYLSDNEVRYMNRDSVWKWLKQLFVKSDTSNNESNSQKSGLVLSSMTKKIATSSCVGASLFAFAKSCENIHVNEWIRPAYSTLRRFVGEKNDSLAERDCSIWMVPTKSANRFEGILEPSVSSSSKPLLDMSHSSDEKFLLAPSTNSFSTSSEDVSSIYSKYRRRPMSSQKNNDLTTPSVNPFSSSSQEGSRLQNQPSLELHNPSLPSYKKTRDYSKPLDLSIQKPSAPDLSKRK